MFLPTAPWNACYKTILLDEIALEGLSGISLPNLWCRMEHRTKWSLNDKLKEQFVRQLVACPDKIKFYELPRPVPDVVIVDRFTMTDEMGNLVEPPEPPDGEYVYKPIASELGSCEYYDERKEIPVDTVASLSLPEIMDRWGKKLVVVASEDVRWSSLAPEMSKNQWDRARLQHYCLLEMIGRSRENGVMTAGATNTIKVVKDPKHLFYIKRILQSQKLITALGLSQKITPSRMQSCILLRLTRFSTPKLALYAGRGIVSTIISRLKSKPDRTDTFSNIQQSINFNARRMKKLMARTDMKSVFKITSVENKKNTKHTWSSTLVKFDPTSDAEESETEEAESTLDCQYRVGVSIIRLAYNLIRESRHKGLSLSELVAVLNVDINGARAVVKALMRSGSIKRILEDRGKQRIGRFVAKMLEPDNTDKYDTVKKELFEYIAKITPLSKCELTMDVDENKNQDDEQSFKISDYTTEVRELAGFEGQIPFSQSFGPGAKLPSYRQLINVNAVLKVVNDKVVVAGFNELNITVQKITNLELMDTKTLKRMIQRLLLDNLVRYYKVKWPGTVAQFSILICAPHITIDHPIVRSHFRDLCLRAYRSVHTPKAEKVDKSTFDSFNSQIFYPKYLRARKLHEFLYNMVYGSDRTFDDLPKGCFNLVDVVPEMTVDLALGHMSAKSVDLLELAKKRELLNMKIKDTSIDVCKVLLGTAQLILTIKRNLRTLVSFGLIQMCDESCLLIDGATQTNRAIYYVNKNARILDTVGDWPRDAPAEVLKFRFDSENDVQEYWKRLYYTAINTNTLRVNANKRSIPPPASVCEPEEAQKLDVGGELPGNGEGAAGLDLIYHVQIPRFWNSSCMKVTNTAGVKRKLVDLHKFKHIVIPRKIPRRARKDSAPKSKQKVAKKRVPKVIKPTRPAIAPVETRKPRSEKLMRNRSMSFSKWATLDDKIIVWTRIAKAILSPTSVPGALQITNFVARDFIARMGEPKHVSLVNSRANSLDKNLSVIIVKENIIENLRRRPEIMEKYYGLFKKLRVEYISQVSKYFKEGSLRMAELVYYIANLPATKTINQYVPCIANDLTDLEERFSIKPMKPDRFLRFYNTKEDILGDTLREAVIQTMNGILGKTPTVEYSLKVYNTFKDYPEALLRGVMEDVHKQGIIVQPKGLVIQKLSPDEALAYSTTYKISTAYRRCWQTPYSGDFSTAIAQKLQTMTPTEDVDNSAETVCILLELSTAGHVDIKMTKKVTVKTLGGLCEPDIALADVDERVSVRMQRGKVGWTFKNDSVTRLVDLFDDIALTNEVACLGRKLMCSGAPDPSVDCNCAVTDFLETRKELGATFQELLEATGMTHDLLQDTLKKLEVQRVVRRAGTVDNRIVLWSHLEPWTVLVEGDRALPAPWLCADQSLKTESFAGWCNAVVHKVMTYPGISVKKIAELCKYISPKHVEDICQFLASFDCVHMKSVIAPALGLFCDDDAEVVLCDSYEYADPEFVLVFPACDMLVKYSLIKKKVSEFKPG